MPSRSSDHPTKARVIALVLVACLAIGLAVVARSLRGADATALGGRATCAEGGPRAGCARPAGKPTVETGLNVGTWSGDHRVAGLVGAKLVRVEFRIGSSVASMRSKVSSIARQRARVLPLAGFHGTLPTSAQARSLGRWAREFGPGGNFWRGRDDGHLAIRDIEFGNETSYLYQYRDGSNHQRYAARARAYGRLATIALDALEGSNVGLMVQTEDAGIGPNWVENMLEAAPGLGERVSAWTVHPYGINWEERLSRVVNDTEAAGAPAAVPIAVTEWGLATANGRCLDNHFDWNRCMTYEQAGRVGRSVVRRMKRVLGARLRTFVVYSSTDLDFRAPTREREHYFGVTKSDQTAKGDYTRFARELFAGRLAG